MRFDELGLSADLLRTVAEEGYTEPTPVQERAIPLVLAGTDVLAAAQTGTGKTAAFTLPILDRLAAAREHLVLARPAPRPLPRPDADARARRPGRRERQDLRPARAAASRPSCTAACRSIPQIKELRAGVEILVATPGRLLDHVGQRAANLGQVEILVLDEADRMLDMGFMPDIQRILDLLAVAPADAAVLGDVLGRHQAPRGLDPAQPGRRSRSPGTAPPPRASASSSTRSTATARRSCSPTSIIEGDWHQVLVFTRTKLAASRLASWLDRHGVAATAIHSDRAQADRTKALEAFKAGEIRVLVATDVAARGLDIEDLPHVVNFELPWNPEDYVHRIGRTGRAGATGDAISLVCIDEADLLRGVQRLLQRRDPVADRARVRPAAGRRGRSRCGRRAGRAGTPGRPGPVRAAAAPPAARPSRRRSGVA